MTDHRSSEHNQGAIDWHTQVARSFDARYATDSVFRERYGLWDEVIGRVSAPGQRALDIGCGPGQFLRLLAERNGTAVGVDGSPGMLAICREQFAGDRQTPVQLIEADLVRLGELGLEPFDLAIASSVLEYLADLDGALVAIRALLKPAGRFVFSLPNRASLYRRLQPLTFRLFGRPAYAAHVRHMATAAEIADRLARHDFELRSLRYFAPTPVLSSLCRPLGLARYSDNLLLVECVAGPVGHAVSVAGGHQA